MDPVTDLSDLNGTPIPVYTIDLSLPPSERYVHLAQDMGPRMRSLAPLFDEVLSMVIPWAWLRRLVEFLASITLRRVYSKEQTEEIRSISRVSGVALHFLIALNVLLDCLLGCTSGGVTTKIEGVKKTKGYHVHDRERMLHFRTLDWGMDGLRTVLVDLRFVRSKSEQPDRVVARTITYAGLVGVLTGVRPNHNCKVIALRWHQLMALFGFRPATPAILRDVIFPIATESESPRTRLSMLVSDLGSSLTAPCYIVLCDGAVTIVLEKDLCTAETRLSDEFIVHTNHDTDENGEARSGQDLEAKANALMMEGWLEESTERMDCMVKKWNSLKKRYEKKLQNGDISDNELVSPVIREILLRRWMTSYPIRNEMTHFVCIMDPKMCNIRWIERGVIEPEERTRGAGEKFQ